MANATNIAQRLETLLQQRKQHADAIANIDQMLSRVAGVLVPSAMRGSVNDDAGSAPTKGRRGRRRGKRGRFAMSGNETILSFVNDHPNATTQQIKQHWASQGRAGGADNLLSILTKGKKLKRVALGKGIRGSSYSVP